ncbi:hypothetical protein Baya_1691 [Bagarius yarrelli]|uniref:Uncharacterized protein n=1 Tax=Bagarius yarrelli TaxID=175774 RepID=A0A556TLV1_BAGYA|nr:hypothetical protein Baya_1691 [Bagarius yarrelli]
MMREKRMNEDGHVYQLLQIQFASRESMHVITGEKGVFGGLVGRRAAAWRWEREEGEDAQAHPNSLLCGETINASALSFMVREAAALRLFPAPTNSPLSAVCHLADGSAWTDEVFSTDPRAFIKKIYDRACTHDELDSTSPSSIHLGQTQRPRSFLLQ